jgi:HD superfamily phosphohydrolase
MSSLNKEFKGKLTMAIEIFKGAYKRNFLHELVAGQIDMDRLDYLRRDSFYTGVIEGSVGSDRIIRMLNVVNDSLVVDEKGIYSLEKFLIARQLMYWQVYMHKTVLAAESMLVRMLRRARELVINGKDIYSTPALSFFLKNRIGPDDILRESNLTPGLVATNFTRLDDSDIFVATRYWADDNDKVLSDLSKRIANRNLLAIELQDKPFNKKRLSEMKEQVCKEMNMSEKDADYYIFNGTISNLAYTPDAPEVKILHKTGDTSDIATFSDMFDYRFMSERITKYFFCYPKDIR